MFINTVNKNNYVSIAKGIAIVLMVIGHAGCPALLHDTIYSFHMPFFFIVSGMFFVPPTDRGFMKQFIKRRIKGLYIPFIKYGLLFLLLHNFFLHIKLYNPTIAVMGEYPYFFDLKDFLIHLIYIVLGMEKVDPFIGPFWFLKSLFLASISSVIFYNIFKTKLFPYIFLLLSLFVSLIFYFHPLSYYFIGDFRLIPIAVFFYQSGYLMRKLINDKWFFNKIVQIFLIALFLYLNLKFRNSLSIKCHGSYLFIFMLTSFSGTAILLNLSKIIEGSIVANFFCYLGKRTMLILTFHLISFKIISLMVVKLYNLPYSSIGYYPVIPGVDNFWILYSIIGVMIPVTFSFIWSFCITRKNG